MPLPFLTADRDTRSTAEVMPPAHEDPERWRRPYRPGPWRVAGAALLLLLTSYLLMSTMIIAFAGAPSGAVVCAATALGVAALALRLLRVGVWVSSQGLRQVGLFYTVTLPWREVAAVRTAQQPVRWLGFPRTVQGESLVIVRTTGAGAQGQPQMRSEPLRPLLTDHNADFLGRNPAFDRAADVIEGWAAESRPAPASV
ncbi:hypothetical protein [Streptomyces oceani]|uniref:Uncharacterized protein n=1 Tax=Streptomyces oceani TaxID=1075402 RepID=A0A1E7JTV2_9ACTN|nr:hypothetical protein [Streptomyces oceani]OEU92318.1 hypothetical protein AN216_24665 [Streptomyces oceani]